MTTYDYLVILHKRLLKSPLFDRLCVRGKQHLFSLWRRKMMMKGIFDDILIEEDI